MKKAILIVSFGTTYTETRIKNITAIKNQVSMLYPDTIIEEAVSSRIVRNHMKQDEHIDAKSPLEALMSLKEQGATGVVVFPTHVIDGIENNQMKNAVEQCRTFFEKIVTADALLSNVDDYTDVSEERIGEWIGELTDDEVKELDVALAISLGMKCRPGQADADTLERLNNLQMELERTKTELKEAKSGPDYKMMYDQLIEKMLSRR